MSPWETGTLPTNGARRSITGVSPMASLLDDEEETEQVEAYEQPLPENGNSFERDEEIFF